MKKLLLTAFLISAFCTSFRLDSSAQATISEMLSKTWQFTMPTTVTEVKNQLGEPLPVEHTDLAEIGFQFRIMNLISSDNGETVIIKFLKWNISTTGNGANKNLKDPNSDRVIFNNRFFSANFTTNFRRPPRLSEYRYFKITRLEFDSRCKEFLPKSQFSVGVLTLPIKIRFGNKTSDETKKIYSSFTGNISAGLSLGYKRNFNRNKKPWSLTGLTGFSLTSVPVSGETTNNFVQSETNEAALTWHVGLLSSIDNFQIGVFMGVDYLSGKINKEWDYRNKPWLGIGIGFSFFNSKKTTDIQ